MDDDDDDATSFSPLRRTPSTTTALAREDCWTEEATYTLIEAWGDHYVELNRGSLRRQHWQEVADAVNSRYTNKSHRSDIQCKNRMDTIKKKYKNENSKIRASKAHYTSPWPFFHRLDSLIGTSPASSPSTSIRRKTFPALFPPTFSVPVGRRSKRPATATSSAPATNSQNFSKLSASELAFEADESCAGNHRLGDMEVDMDMDGAKVYGQLAEAIVRFGEIYKRVEEAKCRQMIELEKQRMEFAKDLEVEKLKIFVDSQIQLHKLFDSKPTPKIDIHQRSPGEQSPS